MTARSPGTPGTALRGPLADGTQIEALVDEAGEAAELLGLPLLPDDLGMEITAGRAVD